MAFDATRCQQARISMPSKAPCSAGKKQNPLHETGVVSPVSVVIPAVLRAHRMDRNTNLTGLTPSNATTR